MRGPRKFCQRESNSDSFFMRGGRIQVLLSVGHHRSADEMPFKWRFSAGVLVCLICVIYTYFHSIWLSDTNKRINTGKPQEQCDWPDVFLKFDERDASHWVRYI